jgi:hypothetical protein
MEHQSKSIPRLIHQTWKSAEIPREWESFQQTWTERHPHWTYKLWTDDDFLPFVQEHFPGFLKTFNEYSYQIQRVDAFRYLILLKYGGVYADLDIECLSSVDALIANREFVIAAEPSVHAQWIGLDTLLCNAFMASIPGHPFLAEVLEELQRVSPRITLHNEVLFTTGPAMLTRVAARTSLPVDWILDSRVVSPFASNSREMQTLRKTPEDALPLKVSARQQGAFMIHYWANTWVRNLAGTLNNPDPFNVPGYRFFPGKDSPGADIGNAGRDIVRLAEECDRNADAIGFNTDGFLKHTLLPAGSWTDIENESGAEGLYLKENHVNRARIAQSDTDSRNSIKEGTPE